MAEPSLSAPDRRLHERRTLRGSALLSLQGRPAVAVRMLHLSAGGMGIVAASNLAARTPGLIRLSIPGKTLVGESFDVKVQVTHSVYGSAEDGFKVGLQFIDMSPALVTAVAQYLAI